MKRLNWIITLNLILFLSGMQAISQTCTPTAPVCVPGNGYAFRYASDTDFGLKFNTATSDYEFTNGSGAAMFGIDANTGSLVIPGTGALQVGPNRYAFQFSLTPNYGLFFNAAGLDYEFRTASAAPIFSIGANSGNIRTMGSVGIGTLSPVYKVDARGDATSTANVVNSTVNHTQFVDTRALNGTSTPQNGYGIGVGGTGGYMGVNGFNPGGNYTGGSFGGYFSSSGSAGTRYGVYATAFNSNGTNAFGAFADAINSGGTNAYGIYASASGATNNWAGYFLGNGYFRDNLGIGTSTPFSKVQIEQDPASTASGLISNINYSGTVDIRAISGNSITADGYGIGMEGQGGWKGVSGIALSGAYSGFSYGVYGSASGSAGTRIGVFGSAFGGARNYGTYTSGNSKVTGNLYVGTSEAAEDLVAASYRLAVDGKIICEELKVENSSTWPDFVFDEDYPLMGLDELHKSIKTNRHLPGIPSATVVQEEGISIGEMQRNLLLKIEELTLYILHQNEELKSQKEQIRKLEDAVSSHDTNDK